MRKITYLVLCAAIFFGSPAMAIHDDTENTKCLDCHFTLPFDRTKLSYTEDVGQICSKCHSSFPCQENKEGNGFSHPLNLAPSMKVPLDMPLTKTGLLTCITCHSYHAEFWDAEYNNDSLLRRSKGSTLCFTCHKKL